MGTNYYMFTGKKVKKTCSLGCVHRIPEKYHIGKSSFGRYFTLHSEKLDDGIILDSLSAWQKFFEKFKNAHIEDEYGDKIEPDEMWKCIKREGWEPSSNAKKVFKKSMIGTRVESKWSTGSYEYFDVWGERGFIKTNSLPAGKDGLYQIMEGDFC